MATISIDKMKPVIYSTRQAVTSGSPMHSLKSWETILVQFNDCIMTDPRTDEQYAEGILALPCCVSKFGNLSEYLGAVCRGKSLDYCKRSTNRMLRKVWGIELDEVVSEGKTLSEMHSSLTDESVHERFVPWAASLFA